nr:gluconokinase [Martelella limonii]
MSAYDKGLTPATSGAALHLIVMGVSGCGKSTVAKRLALTFGYPFFEGDDLHSAANVAKMASGHPLQNEDRWDWLDRIAAVLSGNAAPVVLTCSSLKRVYRDRLRERSGRELLFVYLTALYAVIAERLQARTDHYMPASLLDTQFAALEPPSQDERHVVVNVDAPLDEIEASVLDQYGSLRNRTHPAA